MTVLPSSGQNGFEPPDEAFVARLANEIFRERPEPGDLAGRDIEQLESAPGQASDAAADSGAAAARAAYRTEPSVTEGVPDTVIPYTSPDPLLVAVTQPSSFALRSAPPDAQLPAEVAESWRHMGMDPLTPTLDQPWAAPASSTPPGALSSLALAVEGLRELESGSVADTLTALTDATTAPHPNSALYFLESRAPVVGDDLAAAVERPYDSEALRRDFPALQQEVHGKRLVWLDNAATTQKPQSVIDALANFYARDNSNVHRGAHELAARATDAYEGSRAKVAALLGASSPQEVIFVRGTTEAINLVAQSYGRSVVGEGDEIVLPLLEHHSNIVPWQMLAEEKGAKLRPVQITDRGDVLLDHYASLLGPRTRIVALSHVSNALGTILPVEAMAAMAHAVGAVVVVDGAQGVPHLPVDVQTLGADFYAFSGHKLYGPTGVGVLWGRQALLEAMPPWQGGGSMIKTVSFESTTWNELPYKFEAGTGAIGPAVGLGAAIDYVTQVGLPYIVAHEQALLAHGTRALASIPGLRLIGTSTHKAGVMSFVLDGADTEEIGRFLNHEGIAVRAGHHCAQPALRHYGLEGTVRPSLGLYNTHEDIEALAAAVHKAAKTLRR